MRLEIHDQTGEVVAKQNIGHLDPGRFPVGWDGLSSENGEKVSSGIYSLKILGEIPNQDDKILNVSSFTQIDGVDFKDPDKSLETKLGRLSLSELRGIGEPGTLSLKGFESFLEPQQEEGVTSNFMKDPSMGMNKYGLAAIQKDGMFFSIKDKKIIFFQEYMSDLLAETRLHKKKIVDIN